MPTASGTPTPTYTSITLPTGINFNTSTRVLSGTPTVVTSGTVRIRATNSEGTADWTVAYTTTALSSLPSWIISGIGGSTSPYLISDPTDVSGRSILDIMRPGRGDITQATDRVAVGTYFRFTPGVTGSWNLALDQTPDTIDFDLAEFDGDPLSILSGVDDSYMVSLVSGTAYTFVVMRYVGVLDTTISSTEGATAFTLSLTSPDVSLTTPAFSDDTGDAQSWTQNQAITPLTVPAATGNPAPTYAAVGSLPSGINFNSSTRVISGTPTAISNGTITIRATNSEGSADWTIAYVTTAPAPVITTDTDTVYRLATSQPSAPSGGTSTETHTPSGWTRSQPSATSTQSVWRATRTRTFSDGTFTSATSWGSITLVEAAIPNQSPNADAGSDQDIIVGASVTLDGSGSSDPDGTISSYIMDSNLRGTNVTLTGHDTVSPTFTAPSPLQTLTFRLTVTDNDGATDTDSVNIVVTATATCN